MRVRVRIWQGRGDSEGMGKGLGGERAYRFLFAKTMCSMNLAVGEAVGL